MKRVLTAVVLIPLVVLAVFRAPLWLFGLLLLVTAVVATLEYLRLVEHTGLVPFRRLTLIMTVGFFVLVGGRLVVFDLARQIQNRSLLEPEITASQRYYFDLAASITGMGGALLLLLPFLLLLRGMKQADLRNALPGAAASWFALAYIGFPIYALLSLRSSLFGSFLILYLFVVVWTGDIFAYYVGSMIGQRKLAPRISPGKSWEGAAASFVAAALLGGWLLANAGPIYQLLESMHLVVPRKHFGQDVTGVFPGLLPWWQGILLSAGINIAAQFGDLVESMLKRGAGVKDSGTLLPGHGGLLDRIDALLFAAPVLWYYATFRLIPF